MFIVDRCQHSTAVLTPVRYEYDSKNLTWIVLNIVTIHNGTINEQSFSTRTPGLVQKG